MFFELVKEFDENSEYEDFYMGNSPEQRKETTEKTNDNIEKCVWNHFKALKNDKGIKDRLEMEPTDRDIIRESYFQKLLIKRIEFVSDSRVNQTFVSDEQ